MLKMLRGTLTYANVMATIAVFAALGGGAYAASKIGTKDLADDAKARSINFDRAAVVVPEGGQIPYHNVLKLDELNVSGACFEDQSGKRLVSLGMYTRIPADIDWTFVQKNDMTDAQATHASGYHNMPAKVGGDLFTEGTGVGEGALRFEGQFVYRNSKRVITVTFHAFEDPETARCRITGTAVNGT